MLEYETYNSLYVKEREMLNKQLTIAIIGLSFGGSFVPIYIDHPSVDKVIVYDSDDNLMKKFKEVYPSVVLYHSL